MLKKIMLLSVLPIAHYAVASGSVVPLSQTPGIPTVSGYATIGQAPGSASSVAQTTAASAVVATPAGQTVASATAASPVANSAVNPTAVAGSGSPAVAGNPAVFGANPAVTTGAATPSATPTDPTQIAAQPGAQPVATQANAGQTAAPGQSTPIATNISQIASQLTGITPAANTPQAATLQPNGQPAFNQVGQPIAGQPAGFSGHEHNGQFGDHKNDGKEHKEPASGEEYMHEVIGRIGGAIIPDSDFLAQMAIAFHVPTHKASKSGTVCLNRTSGDRIYRVHSGHHEANGLIKNPTEHSVYQHFFNKKKGERIHYNISSDHKDPNSPLMTMEAVFIAKYFDNVCFVHFEKPNKKDDSNKDEVNSDVRRAEERAFASEKPTEHSFGNPAVAPAAAPALPAAPAVPVTTPAA